MAVPLNARVTPALDPETYLSIEGVNDQTRGYVDDVISFANDAYATLGKLTVAKDLAESNPAWSPEQRVLILSEEANKQRNRLAQRLDRTVRSLEGRIASTEQDLLEPVQQGAAQAWASEIRAHAKSLSSSERSKLIREAMEGDDDATLMALLGPQPFLSGLSAEDRKWHLREYNAKKKPHLVERLETMKRVRNFLNTSGANGPAFTKAFEKVVGAPAGEVRAISVANQKALDALKIEPTA